MYFTLQCQMDEHANCYHSLKSGDFWPHSYVDSGNSADSISVVPADDIPISATAVIKDKAALKQSSESVILDADSISEASTSSDQQSSIASDATYTTNATSSYGYLSTQIQTAIRVLLSVFRNEGALVHIYFMALDDPKIGPGGLEKHLRRQLRMYADAL